jgi:hypothetical protein
MLPTAGIFTKCFEENFLPNGVPLPNSAHKSVSFLNQFLVLTAGNISICWAQPLHGTRQSLEVLLFELGLYQDVFGEHRGLVGAWRSAPKSKLVSPLQ